MAQTLSALYVHVVFSTKDRQPLLRDPAVRTQVHAYLGGISNRLGCGPFVINGTEDHVHILAELGRTISVAEWVKELKRVSTSWIREQDPALAEFRWQGGYGAFSVDYRGTEMVRHYILGQEEHHRKFSFQDEFRKLMREHGLQCDEKYLWE